MSLFGQTLSLYLVIGAGVAGAVFLTGGAGRWFRVLTAVPFWPLYLPLLLTAGRRGADGAAALQDDLAIAIAQADAELEAALGSLDGWAEDVLARERGRLRDLRKRILDFTRDARLDRDIGLPSDETEALRKIDTFLCDLKEAQIRDGLHVFGQSPDGRLERDLLAALARVPRGERPQDQSIIRALADDLALGFDPLTADLGAPWSGPGVHHRIVGDVVEAAAVSPVFNATGDRRGLHPRRAEELHDVPDLLQAGAGLGARPRCEEARSGDGAGALILTRGAPDQGIISYSMGADGGGGDLLSRPAGGSRMKLCPEALAKGLHYMYMDGRAIFRWAVNILCDTIKDVLADARLEPMDVELYIPHQANIRIINAAIDVLRIPRSLVYNNLDKYGNTSAGSVPLAMDEAFAEGRLQAGQRVVLSGFGAGLAWGTAVMQL